MANEHSERYFGAASALARAVDPAQIDAMVRGLAAVRERGGRLFILGVGGGAGHASHAVNDFRKLCLLESYAPSDNVSELTARVNDDGWETSYVNWLIVSRLMRETGLLVFSVGGGSREHNVSVNLVNAIELARERGADLRGLGYARRNSGTAGRRGGAHRRPAGSADAPRRVLPGRRVARTRVPSRARGCPGTLGIAGAPPRRERARAGFIDRDGVINELVRDPLTGDPSRRCRPATWRSCPARQRPCTARGRRLAPDRSLESACSGQGQGLARAAAGGTAEGARAARRESVQFDDFRLCLHHPEGVVAGLRGPCDCRKPAPGMLTAAARDLDIDLRSSWMIGDTDADVLAGSAAGCRTVLIDNPASAHKRRGRSRPDGRAP